MSLSPKSSLTWQIKNFSMCPQNSEESFLSPVFATEMLENSKWQLNISPKCIERKTYVSCYLVCRSTGPVKDSMLVDVTFTIHSSGEKEHVTYTLTKVIFRKNAMWGCHRMVSADKLFGQKNSYLRNDILTIKCWIWRSDDSETPKDDALANRDSDFNAENSEQRDECSVATTIEVQRKYVSWPIKNFSSLKLNERLAIRVPSSIVDSPSFYITLLKATEDRSVVIEIRRQKKGDSQKQAFVKCKASVYRTPTGVEHVAEDGHLFDSDDSLWKLPSFIKLSELEERKYFDSTCDVLHLSFYIAFSQIGRMHHAEIAPFHRFGTPANFYLPIDESKHLHEHREDYDVVIRAGDREFKVLKNILKPRSQVFSAMFDKETNNGVLDISDVDAETLDRMLTFVYGNSLEDLQSGDAIKLYLAADKYQILCLKFRCTWILATSICVSNVCKVLLLANRRHDDFLRDCAESFVRENSTEVFKSEEWSSLMQKHGTFAAQVMLKMLKN